MTDGSDDIIFPMPFNASKIDTVMNVHQISERKRNTLGEKQLQPIVVNEKMIRYLIIGF
jgi:hypothetical protein